MTLINNGKEKKNIWKNALLTNFHSQPEQLIFFSLLIDKNGNLSLKK